MPTLMRIALRNLAENRAKTAVMGGIICLGVAVMVLGFSFMDSAAAGMRRAFRESFTGDVIISGKAAGSVSLFGVQTNGGTEATPPIPEYGRVLAYARAQDEVRSFTSQVDGSGEATLPDKDTMGATALIYLFGIEPQSYRAMFDDLDFISGGYLEPGTEGVLLSSDQIEELKQELGTEVKVGDRVQIQNFGTSIRQVTVRGVFNLKRKNPAMSMVAFVDAQTMKALQGMTIGSAGQATVGKAESELLAEGRGEADLFGGGDLVQAAPVGGSRSRVRSIGAARLPVRLDAGAWNYLLLKLKNTGDATRLVARLNDWFAAQRIEAQAGDWRQAAGPFAMIPTVIRRVFMAAIFIVAVVAVIIIMNTLMANVIERSSEIGTMRALGARKSFVWRMFLTETITMSVVFGVLGIVIGSAIVIALNRVGIRSSEPFMQVLMGGSELRPTISIQALGAALAAVIVIGFAALLYPVAVALKVQPVKAIQAGHSE